MLIKNTYFFLVIATIVNLLISCGGSSDRIEKNIQNSQKLRVGMTLDNALKIMGKPYTVKVYDKKHPKYNSIVTTYYYESPFGASDWIHFRVDTTNQVVEVTHFELKKN